jgi:hypothetical protein
LITQLVGQHGSSDDSVVPNTEAAAPFLTILDKEPKRDLSSNATYKSKVYIVVKNESGRHFEVLYATWEPGDIGLPPLIRQLWEPEGAGGYQANSWQSPERTEVRNVRPGQILRTWIAVNPSVPDGDVRRHSVQGKLGCLIVNFQSAGHTETKRISL